MDLWISVTFLPVGSPLQYNRSLVVFQANLSNKVETRTTQYLSLHIYLRSASSEVLFWCAHPILFSIYSAVVTTLLVGMAVAVTQHHGHSLHEILPLMQDLQLYFVVHCLMYHQQSQRQKEWQDQAVSRERRGMSEWRNFLSLSTKTTSLHDIFFPPQPQSPRWLKWMGICICLIVLLVSRHLTFLWGMFSETKASN